jgi:hypothetical protein
MGLCFRVALGIAHQHTDPSHTVALLRARSERLRHRAGEERDELAPFHCPIPPVLATQRMARLSYGRRLLRRGISFTHDRCGRLEQFYNSFWSNSRIAESGSD